MERQVLLVEDDPQDVELFLLACREPGLDRYVLPVPNAGQAYQLLQQAASAATYPRSLPALVIVDLRMPGMDGLEFIELTRANPNLRPVPIVVLSSSQEPTDIMECYRRGANAYVTKPTDFGRFKQAVELVLRFWLVVNEPPR